MNTDELFDRSVRLLKAVRNGARELVLFLFGIACFAAVKFVPSVPTSATGSLSRLLGWAPFLLLLLGIVAFAFSLLLARRRAYPPLPPTTLKPLALRGPAAFGVAEFELFRQLERESELGELFSWVSDDQSPILALMGDSGVGKTSLLRAGLCGLMLRASSKVAYWEVFPSDVEGGLARAVLTELHAEKPLAVGETADFDAIERELQGQQITIIIDQAERLVQDEQPRFFEFLGRVAASYPPFRTKLIVSFRREYRAAWADFILSIPRPFRGRIQEVSLQPFTKPQAHTVISVLLEAGGFLATRAMIDELVDQMSVSASVVPVDIAVSLLALSEISPSGETRELSVGLLNELGGQEGLLTRYLDRVLTPFARDERAQILRMMLTMVGAGTDRILPEGATIESLAVEFKEVARDRLLDALEYLASSKARILENVSSSPPRIRLIHDRMAGAVRRLSGIFLAESEQAELEFERAFRIWLNDRRPRFLLRRRELDNARRFRRTLLLGLNAAEKQRFFLDSIRRRNRIRAVGAAAALLIFVTALVGWSELESRRHRDRIESWGLPSDLYEYKGQLEGLDVAAFVNRLDWLEGAKLRSLSLVFPTEPLIDIEGFEGISLSLKELVTSNLGLDGISDVPEFSKISSLGIYADVFGPSQCFAASKLPADLKDLFLSTTVPSDACDYSTMEWPTNLKNLEIEGRSPLELRGLHLPSRLASFRISGMGYRLNWTQVGEAFPSAHVVALQVPSSLVSLDLGMIHLSDLLGLLKSSKCEIRDTEFLLDPRDAVDFSREPLFRSVRKLRLFLVRSRPVFQSTLAAPSGSHEPLVQSVQALKTISLPPEVQELRLWFDMPSFDKLVEEKIAYPPRVTSITVVKTQEDLQPAILDARDLKFPEGLRELRISGLRLRNPDSLTFPKSLEHVFIRVRESSAHLLSRLPADLKQLEVGLKAGTARVDLRRFSRMEVLKLEGTELRLLPLLPRTLRVLDLRFTSIDDLSGLPEGLEELTLNGGQVRSLRGLPASVRTLHFR